MNELKQLSETRHVIDAMIAEFDKLETTLDKVIAFSKGVGPKLEPVIVPPPMQRVTFHIPLAKIGDTMPGELIYVLARIRRELLEKFSGLTEVEKVIGWWKTVSGITVCDRQVLMMVDHVFTALDFAWLKARQIDWCIELAQKELYVTLQPITVMPMFTKEELDAMVAPVSHGQ